MARIPKYPLPGKVRASESHHPLDAVRARIGTVPDGVIAEENGVSPDVVKAYRRAHDIPPYVRILPKSEPAPAPAPIVPPPSTVARRRRVDPADPARPIEVTIVATAPIAKASAKPPAAAKPAASATPTVAKPAAAAPHPLAAHLTDLGKLSDSEVAKNAGVSRVIVGKYRRDLGIASYTGHRTAGPRGPNKAPGVPAAFLDMLGTTPDAVLAGIAGVPAAAVRREREHRGLPAFIADESPHVVASPARPPAPTRHRSSRIDAFRELVGVLYDSEVAKLAGVTPGGVQQYRRSHGIKPAPGTARATPPASPAAAPAPVIAPPARKPVRAVVAPATPVAAAVTVASPPSEVVAPTAPAPVIVPAPEPIAPIASPAPASLQRAFRVSATRGAVERRFVVVGTDIAAASTHAVAALARLDGGAWTVAWIRDVGSAL